MFLKLIKYELLHLRFQELRKIKLQMKGLKAELGSKDTKLRIMREEIASAINLARQKSASSAMSSSDPTSPSAAESNLPVQVRIYVLDVVFPFCLGGLLLHCILSCEKACRDTLRGQERHYMSRWKCIL